MSQGPAGPLISVVVPAYNAERTLARTLDSVLGQTYGRLEVAVVDDGSTDATAEIAADFARRDPRVAVIRQANAGVVPARNAGLRATRGELVAPLDADDLWAPAKLERQLRRLEEAGPACGLVYCWSADIDEADGLIVRRLDVDRYEGRVLAPLIVANFIGNASAPLIRREPFAALGYWDERIGREGGQGCADWLAYLQLAALTEFALEPAFLVGYRQTAGSMSRDVEGMLHAFRLVEARIRAAHPDAPEQLLRWSRAAYDVYGWEMSGFRRTDLLLKSLAGDPAWLLRRSTRQRFRRWLKGAPEAAAPEARLGFYAMPTELDQPAGDGRWAERRRARLQAMRL